MYINLNTSHHYPLKYVKKTNVIQKNITLKNIMTFMEG